VHFIEERRLLRGTVHIDSVVCGRDDQGFAADEKGALYTFSTKSGEIEKINQEKKTRIAALSFVSW
jgi:hypothetical protein